MSRADDLVENIGSIVGHFPIRSRLGKRNERVYLENEVGPGNDKLYELEEEETETDPSDKFIDSLIGS
jgi:hypothetical protein